MTTQSPQQRMNPNSAESNGAHQMLQPVQDVIEEQPVAVTMATFALGVAAGVCVGLSLVQQTRQRSYSEQLGQKMMDSFGRYVPDTFTS